MMDFFITVVTHFVAASVKTTTAFASQNYNGELIKEMKVEGDLILGGLFPVHKTGTEGKPCGELMEARGIHRLEAMLYAIDQINEDQTILPGYTVCCSLGALVLDTCGNPAYALNQSLEFVRDLIGTMDSSQYSCPKGGSPEMIETPQPIAGVIGGQYSSVTIQVANLLRLFRIVQVSPASSNTDLSDKSKFEYFARTVPSDLHQAKAMVDIVDYFNWSYVSLIFSSGGYGELGGEAFKRQAKAMNVCIAYEEKISKLEQLPSIIDQIFSASKGTEAGVGAKVVVLFTRNDHTTRLLHDANKKNVRNLIWLASDGWESRESTTEGVEETAANAIVIGMESKRVPAFEEYFLSLYPGHPKFERNPWLKEFWETKFKCSLEDGPFGLCDPELRLREQDFIADDKVQFVIDAVRALSYALDMMREAECSDLKGQSSSSRRRHKRTTDPLKMCSALTQISGATLYQTYLLNVTFNGSTKWSVIDKFLRLIGQQDADSHAAEWGTTAKVPDPGESESSAESVSDLLKGLKMDGMIDSNVSEELEAAASGVVDDGGETKECAAYKMLSQGVNGRTLYKTLINSVRFTNTAGKKFKFDEAGDGPAYYRILSYQKNQQTNRYRYVDMGSWHDGKLEIYEHELPWGGQNDTGPKSICSAPCHIGYRKELMKDGVCCWVCIQCEPYEYMLNETTCLDCGQGWWPFENRTACYDIALSDLKYMQWNSSYSVVPCILAGLGILLSITVMVVFVKYNQTAIIKASGRELSYILLCGMIICYAMTYVLLAPPSIVTCGLKRVGVGFGFAVLYAGMLVKTNRIYRIFSSAKRSAQRPRWISPISQVVITGILAGIQLVGSIIWLIVDLPGTRHHYPNRKQVVLMCSVNEEWFLISLAYDTFLIVTCTLYAFKTRKVPENFNEAKFIGFTMYTTCIIWLAFVPIYFGTGSDFQIQTTTLCISISLSATVALFCLFSPKLWVIFVEPENNVRKPAADGEYIAINIFSSALRFKSSSTTSSE